MLETSLTPALPHGVTGETKKRASSTAAKKASKASARTNVADKVVKEKVFFDLQTSSDDE